MRENPFYLLYYGVSVAASWGMRDLFYHELTSRYVMIPIKRSKRRIVYILALPPTRTRGLVPKIKVAMATRIAIRNAFILILPKGVRDCISLANAAPKSGRTDILEASHLIHQSIKLRDSGCIADSLDDSGFHRCYSRLVVWFGCCRWWQFSILPHSPLYTSSFYIFLYKIPNKN